MVTKAKIITLVVIVLIVSYYGVGGHNIAEGNDTTNNINVIIDEDKRLLKEYYELPHIKEFYKWQDMVYSPEEELIDPTNIADLSYGDLRLLRNEIFARNGYLFDDGFLRGYFNRFSWYMPIFGVDSFKVVLTKQEAGLVKKILKEENKRKENKAVLKNGLKLLNGGLIVNKKQFRSIPAEIAKDLDDQNFSIVAANRSMPFYVYDKNAYQYIPHYITTDLYLFILHKYYSRFLEKLDENVLSEEFRGLLESTANSILYDDNINKSELVDSARTWAGTFVEIALYALGESVVEPPAKYKRQFKIEEKNIDEMEGKPSFIENKHVNYKELKPRGHYTKSKKLENYFKGFKWISVNGIDLDDDKQLSGMLALAHAIKNNETIYRKYSRYVETVEKMAGKEDNLSLADLIRFMPNYELNKVLAPDNLDAMRVKLKALDKEKIKRVFGEHYKTKERDIVRVYFLSSTYSISGEIFSRLVHIDWVNSKRPFPRGLDIPAVFGDKTAKNILIKEYKEDSLWSEYLPRLDTLQNQFEGFDSWEDCYGFKGVQTALASCSEKNNYPDFMKTEKYNRKELSTALASWTHIKHDLILYQEKPFAAEGGQGGGPKPPKHYSYVEPNLIFWDKALELVGWLENLSKYEPTHRDELNRIKELGYQLKNIAKKQLNAQEITDEEYKELHYIGGTIEYILFGLLETDHLPVRERSMALIADVYVYNGRNLNVAVGHSDDIYVVVPINDEYYIARGAVFSYYEFVGEINKIYNDEEWRNIIKNGNAPGRPEWLKPIINNTDPLEGQMQFRYPGHAMH